MKFMNANVPQNVALPTELLFEAFRAAQPKQAEVTNANENTMGHCAMILSQETSRFFR
jgi:hypothetical protein